MTNKQFEQLELLYKQILATSLEIKVFIDKERFDDAVIKENHKSSLISKVAFLRKQLKFDETELSIIEQIKNKILKQEKENLERLQALRDDVLVKLKTIHAKEKLVNKYEQQIQDSGSICDYTSD